jgi:hypothetical protein
MQLRRPKENVRKSRGLIPLFAAFLLCVIVLTLKLSSDLPNISTLATSPNEETVVRNLRKKVAVAVTLTKDLDERHIDLMAAVSQSVLEWRNVSKYDVDLVAFVRRDIDVSEKTMRYFEIFGFDVLIKDRPVTLDDVEVTPRSKSYRQGADRSGCCGLAELMKLYALQLTEYHRVVHIDFDALILKNIDHLMDLPDHYELLYTNGTLDNEALSGGVLIFKPNPQSFEEIMAIIRTGDFRYDGSGWFGSRLGYTYGGETVQGVLPFYYLKRQAELHPEKKNAALKLDQCRHNHQGFQACSKVPVEEVAIMHMTLCQKPFLCNSMLEKPECAFHQNSWWNYTHKALDRLGLPKNPRCDASKNDGTPTSYVPFSLE